jgi:reductive dehalogenase
LKYSRRDFLKTIAAGIGIVGSTAIGAGTPLKAVEDTASDLGIVEASLEPYERKLAEQEAYRARLGVRRVERPTYERFIEGPIPRFDGRNTAFIRLSWDKEYITRHTATFIREPNKWDLESYALIAGVDYPRSFLVDLTLPPLLTWQPGTTSVGGPYQPPRIPKNTEQMPVPDPARMSKRIKQVAMFYGADLVGIAPYDERWVLKGVEIPWAKYVISLAIEMDYEFLRIISYPASGYPQAATFMGYTKMAEVAPALATYILGIGYNARACGNDTVLNIPIAMDAGLGEMGRHNMLITPEFGPRVRLCSVITDLPLQPDKPIDFGIQRFCELCNKCARACPGRAIPFGDRTSTPPNISNNSGLRKWQRDAELCRTFWRRNGMDTLGYRHPCQECIRVCPWNIYGRKNNPWYFDLFKYIAINGGDAGKSFIIQLHDFLGYGRPFPPQPVPP